MTHDANMGKSFWFPILLFVLKISTSEILCSQDPSLFIELNDVVGFTLENEWNIQIAKEEIRKQCGITQSDRGPFNPVIDHSLAYTWQHQVQVIGLKTNKDGNILEEDLSIQKLARIGTQYSLTASVIRELNPINAIVNFPPYYRYNLFSLSFVIDQPLLRNFRDNLAAINERASFLELQAVKGDTIQTIANQIRNSVNQYWELVAAKDLLQISIDSLKRLENLAVSTEKLVEGGQLAASELNQQYAELAREETEKKQAEQQLYAAFQNLLISMGAQELCFSLKNPNLLLEEFPKAEEDSCLDVNRMVNLAIANRMDLLAAQLRVRIADLQLRGANNQVLPEMNVRLGSNIQNNEINKRAKPFYSSVNSRLPEVELFAALDFSTPIGNDEALGQRRRRRAEKLQFCFEEADLTATIRTSVAVALRDRYSLLEQLQTANETVEWYEAALRDEIKRMKEGYSTLFVVIDFENRLSDAQATRVLIQRDLAQNIVELLFLTGKLAICSEQCQSRVLIANVKSLEALTRVSHMKRY